ncbi:MAG: DNA polymerase [Candidatus Campbellbacteria bacterium]|nr:DNA polymerase [Candidatus Campbellbacteria bacterium]
MYGDDYEENKTDEKEDADEEENDLTEKEIEETAIALWLLDSTKTNPTVDDIRNYTGNPSLVEAREKIFNELKEHDLYKVFSKIEKPLMSVIKKMEEHGIKLDVDELKKLSEDYHTKKDALEKEIFEIAGTEFNVNSPKQLGEILFEKLEVSTSGISKTPSGSYSTRESELEKLRDKHPIIEKIFAYRELQKLLSTYIDVLPTLVDEKNRLHTTFLQAGTTTGRLASQNPNLQNIPIKTEQGRHIRRAFIAEKGHKLLSLDYSQIELRVAAFLSGDEKLIEVFKNDGDVHRAVAAQVFGVPEEEVNKEMRGKAKTINFGTLYGMGVNAIRRNLGTTRAEAQQFLNDYFSTFSGLRDFFEMTKVSARQKGYTETLFGRKRYFEDINSSIPYIRASAERMATNAPIQGTQSDIIKLAMVEIDNWINKQGLSKKCYFVLQIHDELVFEVEESEVEKCAKKIADIMENIVPLEDTAGIPLRVEAAVGENWMEMENI